MATISAPRNPANPYRTLATKFVVLLGPEDGTAPTLANEVNYLIPQRISIYANGGRDDVMSFTVDMKKLKARLTDTTIPVGYKRQIEVRTLDDKGKPTVVLAWGFIARQSQVINGNSEGLTIEARLDQHVFGNTCVGYPVFDPTTGFGVGYQFINRPMVFNPEIDEIVEPNMSDRTRKNGDKDFDSDIASTIVPYRYFLHPESMRTSAARALQGQVASLWTIRDAVYFLCSFLNSKQTYIKNPTRAELDASLSELDSLVKNVEIPFGCYLPEALDRLLLPAEYGWHLVHKLNGTTRETRMRFFKRGQGLTKQLHMQRIGQRKTLKDTNVEEFSAQYSLVDMANRVLVYGDHVKREATFRLQKGWAASDDNLDLNDLEKTEQTAIDKPFVGRKWVLNEAGDYIGTRPEITSVYRFDSLFSGAPIIAVRRRKFEKCLSQHSTTEDKESNRFRVDWYDWDAGGTNPNNQNDVGWTRVKWPFSVLEKECGIIFEGPTPPEDLWSYMSSDPSKALVRITAMVTFDNRIVGVASRRDQSPNGLDLTMVIELKSKFQQSKIATGSLFDGKPSLARDDTTEIDAYASTVRDIEDAAQVACSPILEGVNHPEYEIGDLIDRVDGRNLSLNGYAPYTNSMVEPRRPQIVGLNYHLEGGQRLELLLESFKGERPQLTTHKTR